MNIIPIGAQNKKHTGSDLPVTTSEANKLAPSNNLTTILL